MFDLIAEQKIAEAVSRGELDDLPGAGRPLELDGDSLVPEDLRLAYRILKNAGFVPPEVDTLNPKPCGSSRFSGRESKRATTKRPSPA